jgi:hypothetical protein
MVDVQTCPSLEDIAAFLDGRVTADERARLIRHLADCPTCLAVFAGAAQFLAEEAAVGGGREGGAAGPAGARIGDEPAAREADRKAGATVPGAIGVPGRQTAAPSAHDEATIRQTGAVVPDPTGVPGRQPRAAASASIGVPGREAGVETPGAPVVAAGEATLDAPPYSAPLLPFQRFRRARPGQAGSAPGSARWPRGFVAGLAAALLGIAVGVPAMFFRMSSKPPSSADWVKPLPEAKALISQLYREPVTRGGPPQEPSIGSSPDFMLGVDVLDLYIALAADDTATSAEKARNILARMDAFTPPEARKFYDEARELERNHKSPRSLLARALAAERALEDPGSNLPVGRWVETARLAAASGNRDFFHRRATRSFLGGVLDRKDDILDPGTRPVLENIRRRVESDDLGDLGSLYRDLDQLIRTNEAKSKPPN